MFKIARTLALCSLLLFGGALLMAATTPPSNCRIQYYLTQGNNAMARCAGECATGVCSMSIANFGMYLGYWCGCPNGQLYLCPGILLLGPNGIGAWCWTMNDPCGVGNLGECVPNSNPFPVYADVCVCQMP